MPYRYKCKDCGSVIEVEREQPPYAECPQCDGELCLLPDEESK